jgi:hypothetical protein
LLQNSCPTRARSYRSLTTLHSPFTTMNFLKSSKFQEIFQKISSERLVSVIF